VTAATAPDSSSAGQVSSASEPVARSSVEPAEIAGCQVQLVEAVRDVRVVVEVRGELRAPVARRPPERFRVEELAERNCRF